VSRIFKYGLLWLLGSGIRPLAASAGTALIYTRMGVVFKATEWTTSRHGVQASGVWSTGPASLDVFLPWSSVDSVRLEAAS
jgi:hypothetical protein